MLCLSQGTDCRHAPARAPLRSHRRHKGGQTFLFDYLKYAFFLLLMSVVSFLLFDVHLNVLVISLYFSLVEYGIEFVEYRKKLKTQNP